MGVPVTFLSANSRSLLGNAVTGLVAGETYLVVPWSEVADALGSNPPAPNSLEDWLAAISYKLSDRTIADTNSSGVKITAGRRFLTQINGKGLDNGQFESGVSLAAYQVTTTLYTIDANPDRPAISQL